MVYFCLPQILLGPFLSTLTQTEILARYGLIDIFYVFLFVSYYCFTALLSSR